MTINIMAATGQLGQRVVQSIIKDQSSADNITASVRSPEKALEMEQQGVNVSYADYDDIQSMENAFRGSEVLVLIPSPDPVESRIIQHFNALEAAKKAGVRRIVFASFSCAIPESRFLFAPFLLYAESKLRLSGMDWTILRNYMYMDSILNSIPEFTETGKVSYPVRSGRIAYICRDDLARATATVALNSGHSGKIYQLSGSRALSAAEMAGVVSRVLDKSIEAEVISEQKYEESRRKLKIPEPFIRLLISSFQAIDNKEFETVTGDVESITGKPPESLEEYLKRSV